MSEERSRQVAPTEEDILIMCLMLFLNKKKTANNLTVNMRTLEIQSEGTD